MDIISILLQGKSKAREKDPLLSYSFSVELTEDPFGLLGFKLPVKGFFTELSGLAAEYEMIEYKTTNVLGFPHTNQVMGRPVYSPITLRRGVTDSVMFWYWHDLMILGAKPLFKAYVMLTMYDRNYKVAAQWSIERAWPTKVSGVEVKTDSNDIAIEELTLAHGGVTRQFLDPASMVLQALMEAIIP